MAYGTRSASRWSTQMLIAMSNSLQIFKLNTALNNLYWCGRKIEEEIINVVNTNYLLGLENDMGPRPQIIP